MSYPKYNEDNRKILPNQRPHNSLNKSKENHKNAFVISRPKTSTEKHAAFSHK